MTYTALSTLPTGHRAATEQHDDLPATQAPERLLASRRARELPAFLHAMSATEISAWESDLHDARTDLAAAGLL